MFQQNVGAVSHQSQVRPFSSGGVVANDVSSLTASLGGLVAVLAGEALHHLAGQDKGRGAVVIFKSHFPGSQSLESVRRAQHQHLGLAVFLLEVFQQADLGFMFNRLVSGAIFAHAEAVVSEHVLDREAHQGRHTDGRLHEVAEHEEGGTNRIQTAVEGDSVTDGTHGQFGHAYLHEGSLEVVRAENARLVEEGLGVVGVGKVCRTADDVVEILGQIAQHRTAGNAGSHAFLDGELGKVQLGSLAREPFVQSGGLLGVSLIPFGLLLFPFGSDAAKFLLAILEASLHVVEHLERVFGIATQVLDGGLGRSTSGVQGLTVGAYLAFVGLAIFCNGALGHSGVTIDEYRAFLLCPGRLEGLAKFGDVAAIAFDNAESPGFILGHKVVAHDLIGLAAELHLVSVVEENQVGKFQVTGNAAHAVGDFLFKAAIGNQAHRLVFQDRAKTFHHEAFGNGGTQCDTVTDSERARRILDTEGYIHFGVAGSAAVQLAEVLDVFHVELANQQQL